MQQELHNRVTQTLLEFESMENIQPSAEWNDSLTQRLSATKQNSTPKSSSTNFALMMLFMILVNIGFIFKTMINDSLQISNRNKELQVVSKELLFNPTPLDN